MNSTIQILLDQAIFSNTNALFNKTQLVMIVWTCWQTVEDLLAAAIVSVWLISISSISIIIDYYSFIQSICFHSSSFSVILFIYIIFWSILPDVDNGGALFIAIFLLFVIFFGGASFQFGFPHNLITVCRMVSIEIKTCYNNCVGIN